MAKQKSTVNLDYLKDKKKYPLINQKAVSGYQAENKGETTEVIDPQNTSERIGKYGSALNIAIDQARQQRKDSVLDMVGGMAPKGALSATSFASVLGQFNSDSAPLETSLLNNAMSFAQEQNKSAQEAQNAIRELSLKVIEAGGSTETVAAVLAFSETGDIDAAIKAAGASLSAASGDIKTVGNNLLRVKPDGTYEVIYSAPKTAPTPKAADLKGVIESSLRAKWGQNPGESYANTGDYVEFFNGWVGSGKLAKDYFAAFNPNDYINPNDPSVPEFVRREMKAAKAPTQSQAASNEPEIIWGAPGWEDDFLGI